MVELCLALIAAGGGAEVAPTATAAGAATRRLRRDGQSRQSVAISGNPCLRRDGHVAARAALIAAPWGEHTRSGTCWSSAAPSAIRPGNACACRGHSRSRRPPSARRPPRRPPRSAPTWAVPWRRAGAAARRRAAPSSSRCTRTPSAARARRGARRTLGSAPDGRPWKASGRSVEGHGRSVGGHGRPWKASGRPWKAVEGQWKAMEGRGRPWKASGRPWKAMEGQ